MRLAVIGDIHSNKYALESVLKDIEKRNVDRIISTGDLVGYLPFPNEVIDSIKDNNIVVAMGNHDERIGNSTNVSKEAISKMTIDDIHKKASMAFTDYVITDDNRDFLKNLDYIVNIKCDNKNVMVFHGSPESTKEYLYEDSDELESLSKSLDADIIIFGHTHLPYCKKVNNKYFINVGSVGRPKDGNPKATYSIIDIDGVDIKNKMIKVDYDIDSLIEDIQNNEMISNDLIELIKEGK